MNELEAVRSRLSALERRERFSSALAGFALLLCAGIVLMGQTSSNDAHFGTIRANEVIVTDSNDQPRIVLGTGPAIREEGLVTITATPTSARIVLRGDRSLCDLQAGATEAQLSLVAFEPPRKIFTHNPTNVVSLHAEWDGDIGMRLIQNDRPRALLGSLAGAPSTSSGDDWRTRIPASSMLLLNEDGSTAFKVP